MNGEPQHPKAYAISWTQAKGYAVLPCILSIRQVHQYGGVREELQCFEKDIMIHQLHSGKIEIFQDKKLKVLGINVEHKL